MVSRFDSIVLGPVAEVSLPRGRTADLLEQGIPDAEVLVAAGLLTTPAEGVAHLYHGRASTSSVDQCRQVTEPCTDSPAVLLPSPTHDDFLVLLD